MILTAHNSPMLVMNHSQRTLPHRYVVIPAFSIEKRVPKSVGHLSVTFLVNVSPKPLEVATSNFVAE